MTDSTAQVFVYLPRHLLPTTATKKFVRAGLVQKCSGPEIFNLGLPVPFCPFWGEGSPTKIDYRKMVLASPLEDLARDLGLGASIGSGKG